MDRALLSATLTEKLLLSARTQTFHFRFEIAGGEPFGFAAGQFVSLVAADGRGKQQTRAYSIASAPAGGGFELCVNRVEGGFFSNLLADLAVGGTVQFHGPHGLFTLREPLTDSVLVATGTGIAPMRGFVQQLFPPGGAPLLPPDRRMWLVYGTRYTTELYYRELFEELAAAHTNFRYVPTLSRPESEWSGARGYVQERVAEILQREEIRAGAALGADADPRHPEADTRDNPRRPEANVAPEAFSAHAYICGLNAMVSATRDLLKGLGWHRRQIVFERYD